MRLLEAKQTVLVKRAGDDLLQLLDVRIEGGRGSVKLTLDIDWRGRIYE